MENKLKKNEKKLKTVNKDVKKTLMAILFIGISIVLILISIIIHLQLHYKDGYFHQHEYLANFLAQLSSHFGIGILAIGILTIMLDLSHWREYFENRLSQIVIKKEYLNNLKKEDLMPLQKEVLKAYFKNDDIGGDEGFLNYFQDNFIGIIGLPYRMDVNMNLNIKDSSNENLFEIEEILSYTCMNNGSNYQTNICYQPDDEEHYLTKDFKVTIQHPDFIDKNKNPKGEEHFNLDKLKNCGACNDILNGFNLDITEYKKPGLKVMVIAEYSVNKHRFLGWRMSHPSNKVNINIHYPVGYKIHKECFFNNDKYIENNNFNGNYALMINSWLLPDEGIVIQLIKDYPKELA
ncbi:MAG: hypothetical protein JNN23_02610 [Chryseobacterium gambrini]|nr:hypothetical protein [Chryseobacterium gambrini]